MNKRDWRSEVSQPEFGMVVQRGVFITSRDGTKLACDVYLPDRPGSYPALLSYSHYGKDLQLSLIHISEPTRRS